MDIGLRHDGGDGQGAYSGRASWLPGIRLGYGMSLNELPGLLMPYGDVRVANNNSYRPGLR